MVTGREVSVTRTDRRAGDPAVLVADSLRAREELNWVPKYIELANLVRHARRALVNR